MDGKSYWGSYWRLAWRERPLSRFFSLHRAIPGVFIAIAQFIWKHKTSRPYNDMWIAIGIVITVYLVLSTREAIRNFVVISPVTIYARQSETIAAFAKENESRKQKQAAPEVSLRERRRREIVSVRKNKLSEVEKDIVRHIYNHGQVPAITLDMKDGVQLSGDSLGKQNWRPNLVQQTHHRDKGRIEIGY
jgi:hypothetical protein